MKNEEFSDRQSKFYNQKIKRVENGIYEITLVEIEKRILLLEK